MNTTAHLRMNSAAHRAASTKEIPAATAMARHQRTNDTKQPPKLLDATPVNSIAEPIRDLLAIQTAQIADCASALRCMSCGPRCMANTDCASITSRRGADRPKSGPSFPST
jgi:hypothetical protein